MLVLLYLPNDTRRNGAKVNSPAGSTYGLDEYNGFKVPPARLSFKLNDIVPAQNWSPTSRRPRLTFTFVEYSSIGANSVVPSNTYWVPFNTPRVGSSRVNASSIKPVSINSS